MRALGLPSRTVDSRHDTVSQAGRALSSLAFAAIVCLAAGTACAERLADCVEVYSNTGANRLQGYTRIGCQAHCQSIQGWIDCYWDGSIVSLTGPSAAASTIRTRGDT
jgi:hypothetical protein